MSTFTSTCTCGCDLRVRHLCTKKHIRNQIISTTLNIMYKYRIFTPSLDQSRHVCVWDFPIMSESILNTTTVTFDTNLFFWISWFSTNIEWNPFLLRQSLYQYIINYYHIFIITNRTTILIYDKFSVTRCPPKTSPLSQRYVIFKVEVRVFRLSVVLFLSGLPYDTFGILGREVDWIVVFVFLNNKIGSSKNLRTNEKKIFFKKTSLDF